MAGSWQTSSTDNAPDPLAQYQGKAFVSKGPPKAAYVGRVVVEVWSAPDLVGTSRDQIAISIESPGDPSMVDLLDRVAATLPGYVRDMRNAGIK